MFNHSHVFTPTSSTTCQGYETSTRQQCDNDSNCNAIYCDDHANQLGKCRAIKRDGWRCKVKINHVYGHDYYCFSHRDWATPYERVCQGRVKGEPCYRCVTYDDYDYCMPQHDGRVVYYDPLKLRLRNLQPLDHLDDVDRYNPCRMLKKGDHNDHICELQMVASVLSYVTFDDKHEQDLVVKFAKCDVLNESFNLCRTDPTTNLSKGSGTTKFLRDATVHSMRAFGMADERALEEIRDGSIVMTFDDHLLEQKLSRDSTRAIRREMKEATKTVVYRFADEGDTPVFNDVARVTLKMAQAMGLD